MRLRFDVEGKHSDQMFYSVIDGLERRFSRAKKESLREFFQRVKARAIENIYENNAETNVPLSGKLEHSIRYDVEGRGGSSGRLWAGDENTPYARLHNLEPGKKDFDNLLLPSNGRLLVFFNHRTGQWNRKHYVFRPGIAFLSRAWDDTLHELPDIIADRVDQEYNS